jgi:hypothetical protein
VSGDRRQRVAALQQGGEVILGPAGVRMVIAALELATRQAARHGGGAVPTGDLGWLRAVLAAAESARCAPATSGVAFRVVMPPSGATVTVSEAAAIWGVSPQAIRAAITAGRLTGRRHGGAWVLDETQVRQAAGTRRRSGRPADLRGPGGDR